MLAFTFPGQGSQQPGMGTPWVDHPSWSLVDEASEAIGRDVAHLLLDAEAGELTSTANAQVATYVLSLVVLDAVGRTGVEPVACAGHSLGEYTALTAAGALPFATGVRLVRARGDAMQAAADARPGAM
ncbi:MAG: acyltransferase domain-containing protein, partial [Actinomycetota bacterium]|nr:acyltransferase domain-containing protein [Actinomycetota bacterium]